ncbi:MAG: biopolymer transporter ExbD [Pirellulales bacterium]|jgi:biopolymer transport protein ExbD|nr:biopolymer transporter ExbD [Pirellulales bacterium]
MKIRHTGREDKIELQMTPMIDIVFLLLIFFIMTFKIVLPEGDFNIRMPSPASNVTAQPSETPTLMLRITADPNGTLAGLRLDNLSFGNGPQAFAQLHAHIRSLIDDEGGPGSAEDQEVELDCDYNLDYGYVVRAITAITGYVKDGQQHKLIERIKFSPPKDN